MRIFGFIILFISTALAMAAPNNRNVIAPQERQKKIDQLSQVLAPTTPVSAQAVALLPNPFAAPSPAMTAEEAARSAEASRTLSEAEILREISERYRPRGKLISGAERMLFFGDFSIPIGDSFEAESRGRRYSITVTDIQPASYELALGQERIRVLVETDRPVRQPGLPASESSGAKVVTDSAILQALGGALGAARSDRDTLEAIALRLPYPSRMSSGGQPILILAGQQLRKGDSLLFSVNGRNYLVTLSDIQQRKFKLTYNTESMDRPLR